MMLRATSFIVATALFGRLADAGTCKADFPQEAWAPRAAFEASHAGTPNVTLPLIGSGFNRTLNIDGFCNDILMKSSVFTCSKTAAAAGEFKASVTDPTNKPTGAFLRFDGVNCPLRGVSLRRTEAGAQFDAEIRFEFEFCKAAAGMPASPVASAAVVLGLRKETGRQSNLLPWIKEVCNDKTTPAPTSSVVVKSETQLTFVGNGTCKQDSSAPDPKKVSDVANQVACSGQCRSSILIATEIGKKEEACGGFSYNAKTKVCLLFTGKVDAIDKQDADLVCYAMDLKAQDYQKTTSAPPPVAALPELTQNLHLREVFAGAPINMSMGKLLQIQPQTGDDFCFAASWWFTLQDERGNDASVPVMEAEWDELMSKIPLATAPAPSLPSTMIMDRVLVKTCNPHAEGWGRSCIMPEVNHLCDHRQIVNAVVTGILVPVLGWLMVQSIHKRCVGARQMNPTAMDDARGELPRCTSAGIFITCIGAVFACCFVAAASSSIISYSFGAAGCIHGIREMLVIGCATAIPGSFAMIVGLLYLYHSGTKHQLIKAADTTSPLPKGRKLMLVGVPPSGDMSSAMAINPDIMQTGQSAMASYQGHSRITVDDTSQILSHYQNYVLAPDTTIQGGYSPGGQ
jgi:hypothetical protein